MKYIDTHFHTEMMRNKGLETDKLLEELFAAGFSGGIDVGTHPDDIPPRKTALSKFSSILLSGGIFPGILEEDSKKPISELIQNLDKSIYQKDIQFIGEFGLDYYWGYGTREEQKDLCIQQLKLANTYSLPVIIHNRDADSDILKLLEKHPPQKSGIMHCFSSNKETAERILELGMYISFAGNVTFKNSRMIQEAAEIVPLNRILVETDAPYLAPIPERGKTNHPGYIIHTYKFLAAIKQVSTEALTEQVMQNFTTLVNGAKRN
ncbi:MAG: TatD family hydrolase [Spirochaetia bacterium]|nr:TatD family hydrolase [Spirochaetia bacterium]MCF7953718.1 TatD family hydrolase [Spirochaetales bacterium]